MAFKEVGVILGTEGAFRNFIQIKIGNSASVKFDFLEWWKLHQLHPQDWIVIHTHLYEVGACFSDRDNEFYEALELAFAPYHSLFTVYQPKSGDFVFKYEGSIFTGIYDIFGDYLKNVILPSPEFQEPLCKGLKMCFHLDYIVRGRE